MNIADQPSYQKEKRMQADSKLVGREDILRDATKELNQAVKAINNAVSRQTRDITLTVIGQ